MAITFNEVKKREVIFDASGVENPNEWLWDTHSTTTEVYYPVRRTKNIGVETVQDLIDALMKVPNKQLPVYCFDCEMHNIVDVDITLTDRVDINIHIVD